MEFCRIVYFPAMEQDIKTNEYSKQFSSQKSICKEAWWRWTIIVLIKLLSAHSNSVDHKLKQHFVPQYGNYPNTSQFFLECKFVNNWLTLSDWSFNSRLKWIFKCCFKMIKNNFEKKYFFKEPFYSDLQHIRNILIAIRRFKSTDI